MPKNIKSRKSTSGSRSSALRRTNQQANRCKVSSGKSEVAPRVIANSIFALTLKPKTSLEIHQTIKKAGWYSADHDYEAIYRDILPCIQNAIRLVTGEQTKFDPLKNGYDLSESFDFIFNMFRTNVLPKNFEFNIEHNEHDDEYFIVIYRDCPFNCFWHAFEIKRVVVKLYKANRRLHNMFLRFIKSFSAKTNIDLWYNGALGFVDDEYLLEHVENDEFESEEEEMKAKYEVSQIIEEYKNGEAKWYEEKIKQQKPLSIAQLRKQLSGFSSRNKLVKWMKETLVFMEDKATATDFTYPQMVYENDMGLPFDQQVGIIWNGSDRKTEEQEGFLEAEAGGMGICEPMLNISISKNSTSINIPEILESVNWPRKLTEVYNKYYEAIN